MGRPARLPPDSGAGQGAAHSCMVPRTQVFAQTSGHTHPLNPHRGSPSATQATPRPLAEQAGWGWGWGLSPQTLRLPTQEGLPLALPTWAPARGSQHPESWTQEPDLPMSPSQTEGVPRPSRPGHPGQCLPVSARPRGEASRPGKQTARAQANLPQPAQAAPQLWPRGHRLPDSRPQHAGPTSAASSGPPSPALGPSQWLPSCSGVSQGHRPNHPSQMPHSLLGSLLPPQTAHGTETKRPPDVSPGSGHVTQATQALQAASHLCPGARKASPAPRTMQPSRAQSGWPRSRCPGPSVTHSQSEPQALEPSLHPWPAPQAGRHKVQSGAASPGQLCKTRTRQPQGNSSVLAGGHPSRGACPQGPCRGPYASTCMTLAMHPKVLSPVHGEETEAQPWPPRLPGMKRTLREETRGRKGPSLEPLRRSGGLPAAGSEHWPLRGCKQGQGRLAGPSPHSPCFVPTAPARPASILSRVRGSWPAGTPGARPRAAWPSLARTRDFRSGSWRPTHAWLCGRRGLAPGSVLGAALRGQQVSHMQGDFLQRPGQHRRPHPKEPGVPPLSRDPGP